jgi:hypothetical protein
MNLDELKETVLKPYAHADAARVHKPMVLDDGESAFFQLQLTYIEVQQHAIKHKPLRAMEFIPVTMMAPPGANSMQIRYYDLVGNAKIVHDYASDFPMANTVGSFKTVNIKSLGSGFQFSVQEIREAQMSGTPLDQREAMAAERAIDELIDSIAWMGDKDTGLNGLLNYPGIGSYTLGTGGTGSTLWSTKTSDQIIADVVGLISSVRKATNGKEIPDTLLMSQTQFLYLAGTRLGSVNNVSLLTYLTETLRVLGVTTIDWVNELENFAGATVGNVASGNTYANRIIVYKKDLEHLRLEIPVTFEMFPPQVENLVYKIPSHARCAGVIAYYPLSIAVADGT